MRRITPRRSAREMPIARTASSPERERSGPSQVSAGHHEGGRKFPGHEAWHQGEHPLALVRLVGEPRHDYEVSRRREDVPRRHRFVTVANDSEDARKIGQHEGTEGH